MGRDGRPREPALSDIEGSGGKPGAPVEFLNA
jgi:hypothetical protein